MAEMFFCILKEIVPLEKNASICWVHICGEAEWPIQVYVFAAPQFHKSTLIPFPAGLTVEVYGSAKLTSYLDQVLKNLKLNEK